MFTADFRPASAEQLIRPAQVALLSPPKRGLTLRGMTRGSAIEQVEPGPHAKKVGVAAAVRHCFDVDVDVDVDVALAAEMSASGT